MKMEVQAMRWDRTVERFNFANIEQCEKWMAAMGYQKANDGMFVPACDLSQYEAGRRPVRQIR
jgi:hypothetical protein